MLVATGKATCEMKESVEKMSLGSNTPIRDEGARSRMSSYAERVLDLVDQIPVGRVLTYGDIAEFLGSGGPRQVEALMAATGGIVPWWRVVNASGRLPAALRTEAGQHYIDELTPYDKSRERVILTAARWDGR